MPGAACAHMGMHVPTGAPAGASTATVLMPLSATSRRMGETLVRPTVPVAAPVLMLTLRNAPCRELPSTLCTGRQRVGRGRWDNGLWGLWAALVLWQACDTDAMSVSASLRP